jgi:hypothetical protein
MTSDKGKTWECPVSPLRMPLSFAILQVQACLCSFLYFPMDGSSPCPTHPWPDKLATILCHVSLQKSTGNLEKLRPSTGQADLSSPFPTSHLCPTCTSKLQACPGISSHRYTEPWPLYPAVSSWQPPSHHFILATGSTGVAVGRWGLGRDKGKP